MKTVLIVSVFSLPADIIASYRTMAYLKHLKQFGYCPTLLTHYLGMDDQKNVIGFEDYDFGKVIRLPVKKSFLGRLTRFLESKKHINKVSILLRWFFGFLDSKAADIDSYYSMKEYCLSKLRTNQFDLILGIFSPHHHLRLCYGLNKKFRIPYILDFRDPWHHSVIHRDYQMSLVEKIHRISIERYWRKWLSKAEFITTTSEDWRKLICGLSKKIGYVVSNGFDDELFSHGVKVRDDKFVIIYAGSLYNHQDLNTFLNGCQKFIETEKPSKFEVLFFGSNRESDIPAENVGFLNFADREISKYLSREYFQVTNRRPKEHTIKSCQESTLLLFIGNPNIEGWHSGKIFDYLGAKRPILLVPNDHGVIEKLILETNAGYVIDSSQAVTDFLKTKYTDWLTGKEIPFFGDASIINRYTRKHQVEKLSNLINKYL